MGVTPDFIEPQDLDESPRPDELPRPHAERLAREKALAAARPGHFTLAADTVVAVGRRILPKAETPEQALACLNLLSGRRHHVLTALVLVTPAGTQSARLSESTVIFVRLTDAQKQAYIGTGEWHGKAGGYAIQGIAATFIRALSGSYSGVMGLPLFECAQLFRGQGISIP